MRTATYRAALFVCAICLSGVLFSGATQAASRSRAVTTPTVKHVVWVMMENHSYSSIVNASATDAGYIHTLMSTYGSATNMWANYHPSLPNYLNVTSGSNQGITIDCPPAPGCETSAASVFSQFGLAARSLEESMPSNCDHSDSGNYAVRHNPEVYYTRSPVPADCATNDVPLNDSAPNLTAAFTFITPNLCHDMHTLCSSSGNTIKQGNDWLKTFVPTLLNSTQYKAGNTVVVISWDEGDFSVTPSQVAAIVINPWGAHDTSSCQGVRYTHDSMLKYVEDKFGKAELAGAATATSMAGCFGLP